jgi:predicted metal-dependent hydrolase
VYRDGAVVLTVPHTLSALEVERFVESKSHWVSRTVDRVSRQPSYECIDAQKAYISLYRKQTASFVTRQLTYWNSLYGFSWSAISVRKQKSRWGSCSRSGRLSFNYKISLLPVDLADYIIVHELCHLREFNHKKTFWALVERAIPDYKERRARLNRIQIRFH